MFQKLAKLKSIALLLLILWVSSWGLLGHIHLDKNTRPACQTCSLQAQMEAVLSHGSSLQVVGLSTVEIITIQRDRSPFSVVSHFYFLRGPPVIS